jgi:hypothetical protein
VSPEPETTRKPVRRTPIDPNDDRSPNRNPHDEGDYNPTDDWEDSLDADDPWDSSGEEDEVEPIEEGEVEGVVCAEVEHDYYDDEEEEGGEEHYRAETA